jgi:phosphoglycerate kinase
MWMRKIQDADLKDKKVLLRVDFNVPIKKGKIEGDKRIRESLPTIQYLLDHGAKEIILMSHLGKPNGEVDIEFSLWPIANKLAELLKSEAKFSAMQEDYKINGKITLLENLRFDKGEEENATGFAHDLASKGSIYINDAFGTCHRAHASTEGLAHLLPSYTGLLVQSELEHLNALLKTYQKPFTVILGGAKIADKLPTIKNLMTRADNFLIGGAVANTFLAARRHYMGKSLVEPEVFRDANIIWQNLMDDHKRNIYLPTDLVFSMIPERPVEMSVVKTNHLLSPNMERDMVVDIGLETVETYEQIIQKSKTIFWNGNMGLSEVKEFAQGTNRIAEAVISLAKDNSEVQIVIGGGDTVTAVEELITDNKLPITDNLFLSTGGGATLEFLAGKELPGLKALE